MGNYFIYGNVNSADYGVWISGSGTFNKPKRRVQKFSVPGRNGDLTIDEGSFENVTVTYPAFISRGFEHRFNEFIAAMQAQTGYQRLQDTYDADHFRQALFCEEQEPEVLTLNRTGKFELEFDCMPQRFLVSWDEWIDIGVGPVYGLEIHNPTNYNAIPIFRTVGAGIFYVSNAVSELQGLTWSVRITEPTVGSLPDYIDIDCEMEECYTIVNPGQWDKRYDYWNKVVTLTQPLGSPWQFPIIYKNADTSIAVGGDFTSLKVKPRFWEL